jgi:hypothetical protein
MQFASLASFKKIVLAACTIVYGKGAGSGPVLAHENTTERSKHGQLNASALFNLDFNGSEAISYHTSLIWPIASGA